jgi:hypothetical protein
MFLGFPSESNIRIPVWKLDVLTGSRWLKPDEPPARAARQGRVVGIQVDVDYDRRGLLWRGGDRREVDRAQRAVGYAGRSDPEALDRLALVVHQDLVGVQPEEAGSRVEHAGRILDDKEASAVDGEIGGHAGGLERPLRELLGHAGEASTRPDAARPGGTAQVPGEDVHELCTRRLEPDGVRIGDVVTDNRNR